MKILRAVTVGILFILFGATAEAAERVDTVTAKVFAAEHLPPVVQERMEISVSAIAAQLLQGSLVDDVRRSKIDKADIIRQVFDKVLIGYTVAEVIIEPGVETTVDVRLWPWQDVIKKTVTNVSVEGMASEISAMVLQDLTGMDGVFDEALRGLPLAATDWVNGALKKRLNQFLTERLPEFRADFDLDTGEITKVNVIVYPRLPVIRTVDVSMRSDTLPNVSLLEYREHFEAQANFLLGVPVSFAHRHSEEICRLLEDNLDGNDVLRRLDVVSRVELVAAENAQVVSRSDSRRYRLRLTGQLDFGRSANEDRFMLRAHGGRRLSDVDEIFVRADVYPQNMNWHWELGYGRDFGQNTLAEVRYDFSRHNLNLALTQKVARAWQLRYEYRLDGREGEVGLAYRLHDFLQVEYVIDRHENWLRMIGYF